ncbi:steroid transmembrane transporter SLC22A24-like isoform X2 [Babylonia areolata]|uniref:steroid transmembrane transporter SLC22A24-like isoform X2 n=1 Tax=Babylonia areolata TaxID=304850 RepID=UPI003FCFC9A8
MSSSQRRPSSGEKKHVDLDPILEQLGNRGPYQIVQQGLTILASFLFAIPLMDIVFLGYKPPYLCNQVDNVTQLENSLPDDVTNFTIHDIQYGECSINVIVNTSGTSSTHSLPCVAGVNFSMPSHTSFVTEWALVCDKASMAELTQTGFFGGQAVSSLVFSILADRYGRKKVYVVCSLGLMITNVVMALVPGDYYFYLVCKITVGFLSVGMVHSAYTSFMELSPQKWRMMVSLMDSVLYSSGCLFMAGVAFCMQGVSWRYLSLAFNFGFAFTLALPWFLDESLRWLLATGEIEKAEKILEKACRMNGKNLEKIKTLLRMQLISNENLAEPNEPINAIGKGDEANEKEITEEEWNVEVIKEEHLKVRAKNAKQMVDDGGTDREVTTAIQLDPLLGGADGGDHSARTIKGTLKLPKEDVSAKYTMLDLFTHRVVFVPFLVIVFVWMTSNMYYYGVMLGSAKLSGNRFLNFGLLNLQNIPSTLVAFVLITRFNRRPLACAYGILAGCFLIVSVGLVALGLVVQVRQGRPSLCSTWEPHSCSCGLKRPPGPQE